MMTNEKAYAKFLRTGTIYAIAGLVMVVFGMQISSFLGKVLIALGCLAMMSLLHVIKIARYRKNGLRLKAENPNEFNKLRNEYEPNAEKEWNDPGRVYLFLKEKKLQIRAGKMEHEAIEEAARRVERTHPRYHGTF